MPGPKDFGEIRLCERPDCKFVVNNAIEDLKDILQAMSNHILSIHPVAGGSEGGGGAGGAKSNAAIPALEEECDEIRWAAWCARFERWQLACKITAKQVENRILEAIPNQIADTIVVGLVGTEDKAALMTKIKAVMVKKRSVFLYRADFHKISQMRGELPERYAARIRQAAPPCQLMTDSGTADYGPNLMSSIFIIGLSDSYTREKLFQLQPKSGKTTVEFDELVRVASEIQQAKENCLEAGSSSICGVSGGQPGKKSKGEPKGEMSACHRCNTTSHSSKGLSLDVREKFCKAFKAKCKKSQQAMRSLYPEHFVAQKSFLHTWGKSQTVAKCVPCRWSLILILYRNK